MTRPYKPVDLSRLKTFPVRQRGHKFEQEAMARLPGPGARFADWMDSLPPYLGVRELRAIVDAIIAARRNDRPVVFALGAHVVKVGCSTIVCDLMRRGIVTAIAMNGATAIHDVEVATIGETSEEVGDTIKDGSFGMVQETPHFFAEAAHADGSAEIGLGAALGRHLLATRAKNNGCSMLAVAAELNVPVTVHVAVGTDTIHMHQNVAESDLLQRSIVDFRLICDIMADLAPAAPGEPAGVWCNIGSAVILPEVFLKAIAVARNLGSNLDSITTANFDMIRHYRPSQNVIGRPVKSGQGHHVTGHHEIMLPLLRQALIERM